MIVKQAPHKHSFQKALTKIIPVRNAHGLMVAHDTIKLKQCIGSKCKETIAVDMEREIK